MAKKNFGYCYRGDGDLSRTFAVNGDTTTKPGKKISSCFQISREVGKTVK